MNAKVVGCGWKWLLSAKTLASPLQIADVMITTIMNAVSRVVVRVW